MADVLEYLYLNNLHVDVTEDKLKDDLVRQFPEFFREAYETGTLKIQIYQKKKKKDGIETGGIQVSAVVAGMRVNIQDLWIAARGKKLLGFAYRFLPDQGHPRKENGDFVHNMSTHERRRMKDLFASSRRRFNLRLTKTFRDRLHGAFQNYNFTFTPDITLTKEALNAIYIEKSGDILRVQYKSALDCLQNICLLNGALKQESWDDDVSTPPQKIVFMDKTKMQPCELSMKSGIGKGGIYMDFNVIQDGLGFIPLKDLNEEIVDVEAIRSIPASCLICKQDYVIDGVDKNLEYVAGKCPGCSYFKKRDVDDRAYTWPNEQFTRLIELRRDHHEEPYLDVWFKPMQRMYGDGKEYREVVSPIVDWEWYETFRMFETQSQTVPVLEKSLLYQDEETKSILLTFIVKKTSLWTYVGLDLMGSLDLEVTLIKNKVEITRVLQTHTHWLDENLDGETSTVSAVLTLVNSVEIKEGCEIKATPMPDKMQYFAIKEFLKRWAQESIRTPWLRTALNIGTANPVALPINQLEFEDTYEKDGFFFMKLDADQYQNKAIDNALNYATSIVIGPPGTGKTLTSAKILTAIKVLVPEKKAIALAPSNYACDVLADTISEVLERYFFDRPPFSVLRIYARRHERQFLVTKEKPKFRMNVRTLQDEVDRLFEESEDEKVKNLRKSFLHGSFNDEEEKDIKLYEETVRKFEGNAIRDSKFRILVLTAGVFHSRRFRQWGMRPRFATDTILIDEAGYLAHTESLAALDYGQERVIYVGDDRQLRKVLINRSVEITGYANSTIEWSRMTNSNLPSVTLQLQYRMHEAICQMVSELSYADTPLETAKSVDSTIPAAVEEALKSSSPVYVVFHDGLEEAVGNSYSNPKECKIIKRLCDRLISSNAAPHQILVATMYAEQKKILNHSLSRYDIEAKTVDSLLGKENDIVIISFVRSGRNGFGFTKDPNRINVMLSRAKKAIILVINQKSFENTVVQVLKKMRDVFGRHAHVLYAKDVLSNNF